MFNNVKHVESTLLTSPFTVTMSQNLNRCQEGKNIFQPLNTRGGKNEAG